MTLYEVLGVRADASAAEIRKAYRQQALASHPDKNPGDTGAADRFLRVAEAYEVLGDDAKRAQYDRGSSGRDLFQRFDARRASDMFDANFGEALARQWQPGMRVSGTLVSGGKRISVTIHPDGTTEEAEVSTARSRANYRATTTSMPGGGTVHTVHMQGSLGENLAALLVPEGIAALPVVGPLVSQVVSWSPTAVLAWMFLKFFRLI
mmetsp:Transcript_19927/g.45967  ORF Transcript_19927/g.45967 Transcript_19927/m.45967 type:complete len:207 (-) Transcript_19927:283-903(-)|eukprot:CAMPEP_0119365562 /NCGR_PEP_ID=MMETSP1334-20130426/12490_1 /TAXON_ID=127549 /ORGANISM="Calcidiscus leptoporus, Strain RCC1130" /LENGTH=206 /DNA_ID=CAMNT_0007381573 /DNA_START=98 /DNA_END=718 /DNA_ORIENTATION=-